MASTARGGAAISHRRPRPDRAVPAKANNSRILVVTRQPAGFARMWAKRDFPHDPASRCVPREGRHCPLAQEVLLSNQSDALSRQSSGTLANAPMISVVPLILLHKFEPASRARGSDAAQRKGAGQTPASEG